MLGEILAAQKIGLVYGGAQIGIMGAIADRSLACGGEVIGIMPQSLVDKEIAHPNLTTLVVVSSMHERKSEMARLADGFIALPGGIGTLEELFEVLTWAQLGFHQKPCALLNVSGYYDKLLDFINHSAKEGFIKEVHAQMLIAHHDPHRLLELMSSRTTPIVSKWQ